MEIFKTVQRIPDYIKWVRSGRPESTPKITALTNSKDLAMQNVRNAIPNFFGVDINIS